LGNPSHKKKMDATTERVLYDSAAYLPFITITGPCTTTGLVVSGFVLAAISFNV